MAVHPLMLQQKDSTVTFGRCSGLPSNMNHEILSSSGSGTIKKVHATKSWNITV